MIWNILQVNSFVTWQLKTRSEQTDQTPTAHTQIN